MRGRKQIIIFKPFEETVRKMYPYKSMYKATKELNEVLERMLYGIRKKR